MKIKRHHFGMMVFTVLFLFAGSAWAPPPDGRGGGGGGGGGGGRGGGGGGTVELPALLECGQDPNSTGYICHLETGVFYFHRGADYYMYEANYDDKIVDQIFVGNVNNQPAFSLSSTDGFEKTKVDECQDVALQAAHNSDQGQYLIVEVHWAVQPSSYMQYLIDTQNQLPAGYHQTATTYNPTFLSCTLGGV